MKRTIWIFRLMAVLILLVAFALLAHLYSRLSTMQRGPARPPAAAR